ncbi:MAG: hypothetical protein AAGI89_10595 [Pseudomonadota bacterium]
MERDLASCARGFVALCCLSLFAVGLSGCTVAQEELRYRVTVVVDTPSGPVSGSSVIETIISQEAEILPSANYANDHLKGEAVAVDLPNGQVLFALLLPEGGSDPAGYHSMLMQNAVMRDPELNAQYNVRDNSDWKTFRPAARELGLTVTLARSDYPMLVTFSDLDDPTALELINPENLAASFGEGVSLKRITVAVTDDAVTTGIGQRLGWLGKPFKRELTTDDFPSGFPVGDLDGLFTKGS